MKKTLVAILSTLSLNALAQIPHEFRDLIPSTKNGLRLEGMTADNKNCALVLSVDTNSFSASVAVLDKQGNVDSRRFGTFQIGFGHELERVQKQGENTIATSTHEAEESYSSDSRATLKVNKPGDRIKAVQIIIEKNGIFGFKTKTKEACFFKQ